MSHSIKGLKQENKSLKESNALLIEKVDRLEKSVSDTNSKCEQLEGQSRRQNLRFFGLDEAENETWDQTEEKVRTFIKNELKIDESKILIERAHRLHSKMKPRPLIVKFSFFKDKENVLKRYRLIQKQARNSARGAGEKVRISEDFPDRVRKLRYSLIPFLQQALDAGKNAFLRYDKLIINGQTYVYDERNQKPVQIVK